VVRRGRKGEEEEGGKVVVVVVAIDGLVLTCTGVHVPTGACSEDVPSLLEGTTLLRQMRLQVRVLLVAAAVAL
jgi:hypothetical protein